MFLGLIAAHESWESWVTSCSLGCLPWQQQQWPLCVFMKPPCGFSVIQTPYAMLLAAAGFSTAQQKRGERRWKETAVLIPVANQYCSSCAGVVTYSCFWCCGLHLLSLDLWRYRSSSSRRNHKSQGWLQNARTVLLLLFLNYTDSGFSKSLGVWMGR